MMEWLYCNEIGNMDEYVGYKVERDYKEGSIKMTQPVMLQSFTDKFNLPEGPVPNMPATPGDALVHTKPEDCMSDTKQFKYRLGVGKLLHMMCWSCPEILNAVRELSRYMSGASMAHVKAMHQVMKYCIGKLEHGLLLKPDCKWDGR
jgi:hypothetical protein